MTQLVKILQLSLTSKGLLPDQNQNANMRRFERVEDEQQELLDNIINFHSRLADEYINVQKIARKNDALLTVTDSDKAQHNLIQYAKLKSIELSPEDKLVVNELFKHLEKPENKVLISNLDQANRLFEENQSLKLNHLNIAVAEHAVMKPELRVSTEQAQTTSQAIEKKLASDLIFMELINSIDITGSPIDLAVAQNPETVSTIQNNMAVLSVAQPVKPTISAEPSTPDIVM